MIRTRRLTRRFDTRAAVEDLDLDVEPGELYGFLGPNGAGKTTAIRMLNGLLRPTSGELEIAGLRFADAADEIRRITGLVPDTPPLYEFLTGRQYVAFVASLYGIRARDIAGDAERLLDAFDLTESADRLCKGYSHGMRKKLHVAAVLCTRPRLLFLDEPTTGLDPRSARTLRDLLRSYCDDGGTAFLTTHLLDTAERICDRVGILERGRLRAEGTVAELCTGPDESLEDAFLRLTGTRLAGDGDASAAADDDARIDETAAR